MDLGGKDWGILTSRFSNVITKSLSIHLLNKILITWWYILSLSEKYEFKFYKKNLKNNKHERVFILKIKKSKMLHRKDEIFYSIKMIMILKLKITHRI